MTISRYATIGLIATTLALGLTQTAHAEGGAKRAVEAAKQFAGTTLNLHFSAGLMAREPQAYSGPLWEELTGIKVHVIETSNADLFAKTMQDHKAGTGAYDVIDVIPMWLGDFVEAGVLLNITPMIDKYKYRDEIESIAPTYRALGDWNGNTYCLPDDGDQIVLFYRKDLFEDAANQAAFKSQHGYDLAAPKTWDQFDEIAQFFTDKYAPELYGAGELRAKGLIDLYYQERFRTGGGKFFDADTMRATINSQIGVEQLDRLVAMRRYMPPGVDNWGYMEQLSAWLDGSTAMSISWPMFGRAGAGFGMDHEAMNWIPQSQIKHKSGYAVPPGGAPQQGGSFCMGVATGSTNQEAAYLLLQWMNSEEMHPKRSMLPYGLRDPIRTMEFKDPAYMAAWPDAGDFLSTLEEGSRTALMDLSVRSTHEYWEALQRGVQLAISGTSSQEALDAVAEEWDAITDRIGVDTQRNAYLIWANKPNAYPEQ